MMKFSVKTKKSSTEALIKINNIRRHYFHNRYKTRRTNIYFIGYDKLRVLDGSIITTWRLFLKNYKIDVERCFTFMDLFLYISLLLFNIVLCTIGICFGIMSDMKYVLLFALFLEIGFVYITHYYRPKKDIRNFIKTRF